LEGYGTDRDKVASLISDFCRALERDGYQLEWNLDEGNGVLDATVVAGADACKECLVPKEVMLFVLDSALKGSGVRVGALRLPKEI
jgi:hypothetical protein